MAAENAQNIRDDKKERERLAEENMLDYCSSHQIMPQTAFLGGAILYSHIAIHNSNISTGMVRIFSRVTVCDELCCGLIPTGCILKVWQCTLAQNLLVS